MFVHAKIITSRIAGGALKNITCERCATQFRYQLSRVGMGQSTAAYGIGQQRATARAQASAAKNLSKRLAREAEMVPCPSCMWVNESLITSYRALKHRNWAVFGWAIPFAAMLVDVFLYVEASDIFRDPPSLKAPRLWVTLICALVLSAGCFAIQWLLRRRINPNNRTVNGVPCCPPGTPPALIEQKSETGEVCTVAAPSGLADRSDEVSWAVFRPGQLSFKNLCCECLGPADCFFKMPIAFSRTTPVPLCRPCLKRLRKKWWLGNLVATPVAFLLTYALIGTFHNLDQTGRVLFACLAGLIPALVSAGIIDFWIRPYRVRVVDRDRTIAKIRFRNSAYTAILIREMGEADGIY